MTDKDIKDYCKNCDVEPPAMRFKCPECAHNPDKEQIICKYKFRNKEKFDGKPYCTCFCELCEDLPICVQNCQIFEDYKQLQKEKFENLNNRQIVEYTENLIYENSELYINLKEKEHECEELKKEIINKNEKIKELRFSVSDLTNRLCYLNAEKSFRIVDLEQTLDEIEKELKEDIYCENQECGCDDFEECLKCTKEHILDIISKAKGEE